MSHLKILNLDKEEVPTFAVLQTDVNVSDTLIKRITTSFSQELSENTTNEVEQYRFSMDSCSTQEDNKTIPLLEIEEEVVLLFTLDNGHIYFGFILNQEIPEKITENSSPEMREFKTRTRKLINSCINCLYNFFWEGYHIKIKKVNTNGKLIKFTAYSENEY